MAPPPKVSLVAAWVLAAVVPRVAAAQHITVDGRFSPAQTLVGPNYTIGANLGKQVGSNLFQSFGLFGVSTGESATFSGPATVSNVIGRVTGGTLSSINGQIQSTITGANLYLINPSGVVFGPNATVNVSGSFHTSTADYLKMSDGAKFQATNPDASTLSAAPPAAFGFLTASPAKITVNGSTLGPVPGTLGLVGGPVSITGGTLSAPAGTIHVTSAAGTGEVPVDPRNRPALTVTSFGPVAVTGGSTLDVSDPVNLGTGGSVFIRSGALTISASEINADNYSSGSGGRLVLRGDAQLALTDGAYVHSLAQASGNGATVILRSAPGGMLSADNSIVAVGSNAAGNSGKLVVRGDQISLTNGAQLTSTAQSIGNGGTIAVKANSLVIDSGASVTSITAGDGTGGAVLVAIANALAIDESSASSPAGILTLASGPGNAGAVAVTAGSLSILSNEVMTTKVAGVTSTTMGLGNAGSVSVNVAGSLLIDGRLAPELFTGITSLSTLPDPQRGGDAGAVTVVAGSATILNNGVIASGSFGAGNGGPISVNVTGALSIDGRLGLPSSDFSSGTAVMGGRIGGTGIISGSLGSGNGGPVTISAGTLSVANDGVISSGSVGDGNGGSVFVNVAGAVVIDGAFAPILPGVPTLTGVSTGAVGSGNGGVLTLHAGTLTIVNNGLITSGSVGGGQGGSVTVDVADTLLIDGASAPNTQQFTGISSASYPGSSGNAGTVTVTAGKLSILSGGEITSATLGSGNGGNVSVGVAGQLTIDATSANTNFLTGISAQAAPGSTGNAGAVSVAAGGISVVNGGAISSAAAGSGSGGSVAVATPGNLVLDGGAQIAASATGLQSGAGGAVMVQAGTLTVEGGAQIASTAGGLGKGGDVGVTVAGDVSLSGVAADGTASGISASATQGSVGSGGQVILTAGGALSVSGGAQVSSSTAGQGNGGSVSVNVAGSLLIDGRLAPELFTGITSLSTLPDPQRGGDAGAVTVVAGSATILNNGVIASGSFGAGNGGPISVNVTGALSIDGRLGLPSSDFSSGTAVMGGRIGGTGIISGSLGSGNGGPVTISAGTLSVANDGVISSGSVGDGNGGSVFVNVAGAVVIDGAFAPILPGVPTLTGVSTGAVGSGNGGVLTLHAGTLTIVNNGLITSGSVGGGQGGSVTVDVADTLLIDGASAPNTQQFTGISSASYPGSSGNAGTVTVTAGKLSILSGGEITSATLGSGNGGNVSVGVAGQLTIDATSANTNFLTGISAQAAPGSTGNAGAVSVAAGGISVVNGGAISSAAAGSGSGGSVAVATPGNLVLDGGAQIAASATGPQSGPGGSVTVAANSLTVSGGAQIASSTAGPGKGGDVNVTVATDIVLPDPGPQITARSTGSGDAGSVTVSASRLLMNDGAAISTEAETSTASGGNITLKVSDFLFLVSSEITTSVKGETGNGGNIAIDSQLMILNHSSIIAQAIEGHGGNITITADQFIPSSDSIVSASSELGISGTVEILSPRVDVNGALVVLSTELRSAAQVLREACAAQGNRPQSSLVEAGRGGLPQNPEATLPALYIAGRDVNPNPQSLEEATETSGALQTTVRLTMRCG